MLAPARAGTTNWVRRCRRCQVAISAGVPVVDSVASLTSTPDPSRSACSASWPIRLPQYAAYSGAKIGQLAEEAERRGTALEVKDATIPTPATPPEIATWQRRQRITQFAVPVLAGANIVCNSWLVQSYRTGATLKGVLRRVLPGS